jgi:hypothetical protein
MAELLMRNQPCKAAINNTTTTAARGNGPQIRNMVIGFAPALWLLKHPNIPAKWQNGRAVTLILLRRGM